MPPLPRWLTHPVLLLVLTVLFWSGNMVLGRGMREAVPPLTLAFWRWAIAFALTLPLALPHWQRGAPILRAHWKPVLILGLLGVGGYNTLAYVALQTTAATNAVLLNSFIPIATIAIAWAFLGKRLRPLEAAGVLVSLAGVLTIVAHGELAALLSFTLNPGDLWMLGAVLVWAMYTVGLAWRPAGVHPMLMLAAMTAVGLCVLTPAYAWEFWVDGRHMTMQATSFATLAYVGIFPSFLGYIFYNRGVAEVGPNQASLFIHLMPVFGTLLSALFLGEIPASYHYAGIALIFAGIALTLRKS